MVKRENVDLYQGEAVIGLVAFRDMLEAAVDFRETDEESKSYTQATRDEVCQAHLAALPPVDVVVRQAKILIKLTDDSTPPVHKVLDKDKTDGTALFLAVDDDRIVFEPAVLPAIP